jgi:class 3 adenylate cyclase/tetratricopeptide (TPR) repeat protein
VADQAPPQSAGSLSTERRLVSILFADLVGFTSLSETRDAEEVRELLSEYFDSCRTVIARYGGVVEKFIGDAVMAVWGTPTAREDDAERAVRAALELTETVAELGDRTGAPGLRARAGVLTGEAVVNLDAVGQGMVAGDLVNTASRIQSVAAPGSVMVGEATKRATESSIAYLDAGTKELKGKAEPVQVFQALRVVAGTGGGQRTVGLEAPFVGRDRELRMIKELLHASIDEDRAQLVSVIGPAGIGKSRLVWELFKYIDGLAQDMRWHRGRCLAYGEGVAYWPLAEMVRTNAEILEGEDPSTALPKLQTAVAAAVPDPEERRWVEPRLASLLGLEAGVARQRDDLFAAWRLFYERLAEEMPAVLIFEDIHWADPSLLDFVEYLLEWVRDRPIFIMTLARPELFERRPGWGAGQRSATSIHLEPLGQSAMDELLRGLAPGLPETLEERVLERAEGVPLYAVETVRMLLDRGLLERGGAYRPLGTEGTLEVPETLHALIASRLDGLTVDERSAIQDGSVLGKTFSREGLAALSSLPEETLDSTLASLVRKELLAVQADRYSPERGQYGFLGDLVRRVAYETLPKKDRKAKHLAAAAFLDDSFDEDDVVEVVASHYVQAYEIAPDAEDAPAIKAKVRSALRRAGERAASLAASEEAQRYFSQAADLADDPSEEAEILERAGLAARFAGDARVAIERFERSISILDAANLSHPAARVSARLGEAMWDTGRLSEARDIMDRSLTMLADEPPDEDLAALTAQLGRIDYFAGDTDGALERIETALEMAEGFFVPELLSNALTTKAVILYAGKERRREGYALLKYSLELALDHDLPAAAMRGYYNISDVAAQSDRYSEACDYVEQGLALARRIGNRQWEWNFLAQVYPFYMLGQWDLMLAMIDGIPREKFNETRVAIMSSLVLRSLVRLDRGEPLELADVLDLTELDSTADIQERAAYNDARAMEARAAGDPEKALEWAEQAIEVGSRM